MARMRSLKPEFWSDQDLTRLPRDIRLLYMALWNFTDEEARMQGDPRLVKSWCFPLDDDVTVATVIDWLTVLVDAGKVIRYEHDGSMFLFLPKLPTHQKLDPRLFSKLPAPPDPNQSEINTDQSGRSRVENTAAPHLSVAKHVAGGIEQGAGDARAERDADPTRRVCDDHHPDGVDGNCWRCRDCRIRNDAWIADEPVRRRREATDRRAAIDACSDCDEHGRLLDPDTNQLAGYCTKHDRRTA